MRKIIAVLAAVLIILSAGACSKDKTEDYPVILGNITFEKRPESIVCLNDSIADILISCGYSDMITARSDECTQREIAGVPSVGSKAQPSLEKILEAQPDIVFADRTINDEIYDKIRDSGRNIVIMLPAESNNELIRLYGNICAVAEGNNKGRENGIEKINSILMTMSDLQRLVPERDVVTTVCYMYDSSGLCAADDTPEGRILSYTNAVNVCGTSHGIADMLEKVRLSNPDFIFCDKGEAAQIEKNDKFKNLRAVKNNRIYEIDSLLLQRQGNSMTEALSYIIEMMYPELTELPSEESSEPTEISKPEESSEPTEISKPEESSEPTEISKPEESSEPAEISKPEESSEPAEISKPEESSETEESSKQRVEADNSLEIYDGLTYSFGEESDGVYKIQERLRTLGYFENEPTGYFGNVTAEAFESFEAANGISADGIASDSDLRLLFSADAIPRE